MKTKNININSNLNVINLVDCTVSTKLCSTKEEAKALIKAGEVKINDVKIKSETYILLKNEKLLKLSVGDDQHILLKIKQDKQ